MERSAVDDCAVRGEETGRRFHAKAQRRGGRTNVNLVYVMLGALCEIRIQDVKCNATGRKKIY